MNYKFVYGTPMPTARLVNDISDKAHHYTQNAAKRPYGVGFLIACYDQTGAHLYQTDPSGNFSEYIAQCTCSHRFAAPHAIRTDFIIADDISHGSAITNSENIPGEALRGTLSLFTFLLDLFQRSDRLLCHHRPLTSKSWMI